MSNVWVLMFALIANGTRRVFGARKYVTAAQETAFIAACVLLLTSAAYHEARFGGPEINSHRVTLPGLAKPARLLMLSDIHLGPVLSLRFCLHVLEELRKLGPADAVLIVGDLVDAHVDKLRSTVIPQCLARFPKPVYFVTGNHEYYTGSFAEWMIALGNEAGFQVLQNQCVVSDLGLNVAGVNDLTAGRAGLGTVADADRALNGCDRNLPFLVLAHQPNHVATVADALARRFPSQRALMVSGHTHGGQVWPMTWVIPYFNTYFAGYYRHSAQLDVLVGRGTGQWGPMLRLGSRAEIIVLDLQPGS